MGGWLSWSTRSACRSENATVRFPTIRCIAATVLVIWGMGPYTSKKGAFPSIPWSADKRRLISELLSILQQDVCLRKGLWPHQGETPLAQSKATNQRYLAKKLLRDEPNIMKYMSHPTAVAYNGLELNRVTRLDRGQGRMLHRFRMNTFPDEHSSG